MMCLVYSIGFIYAFAALGNLGLIYRERVMLLPFLMVLFAIPRTPRGRPATFEWEYKRKDRKKFRAAMIQQDRRMRSLRQAYVNALGKGQVPAPGVARSGSATGGSHAADPTPSGVDVLEPGPGDGSAGSSP
jgi:hypothetical protein